MDKRTERESSPQILGSWDSYPLDPTPIVMMSPPSSPELEAFSCNDSNPELAAGDVDNKSESSELARIPESETATASKPPSSVVGKAPVSSHERDEPNACSQKQQNSAGNVRISPVKRTAVPDWPSSSAGKEVGISGSKPVSAGNVEFSKEELSTAAARGRRGVLPATITSSEQWGNGKWKEDGRRKGKKIAEQTDTEFLKEVLDALIANTGKAEEEDNVMGHRSCMDIFKSMGMKFP